MRIKAKATVVLTVLLLVAAFVGTRTCAKHSFAFESAVRRGDLQVLEARLKGDPSLANRRMVTGIPLHRAVTSSRPKEVIELLLAYGADINARENGFGLTALHWAAWNGKTEAVKVLLAHKADPNAFDERDVTPLNYAVTAGSKEIIELLLANGAEINRGHSVLFSAEGQESLIELLLSRGANPNVRDLNGNTLLHKAIIFQRTNSVETLLRFYPDLSLENHDGTPLFIAVDHGYTAIAAAILNAVLRSTSNTAHFAAAAGATDKLRQILQANPELIQQRDAIGFTALHWAAEANQVETAGLLVAFGANLNATDGAGYRPLDWAAFRGHMPLLQFLASNGANADLGKERFDIPLLLAVQQGHLPAVVFLLEAGANIGARNKRQLQTPLHLAAAKGRVELCQILLNYNAAVNARDLNGRTPLRVAIFGTSAKTVELLIAHGADLSMRNAAEMNLFHEWALGSGDATIAEMLLSRKVDMNAQDSHGKTPLHHAVYQGEKQAVEWLLKHGADVNVIDHNRVTPLKMLTGRRGTRRKDVVELLQSYGGE